MPGAFIGKQAGFVLAGGNSSRMGRDKALLATGTHTMLEEIADHVKKAAESVTIIGPRERYMHLGLAVMEDLLPACGPLGGLYTALQTTRATWNLVVACDMPGVNADFLSNLLAAACESGHRALVPQSNRGWEPLCAVYHQSLVSQVYAALNRKMFKMQEFVASIDATPWPVEDTRLLVNVNTPQDWPISL